VIFLAADFLRKQMAIDPRTWSDVASLPTKEAATFNQSSWCNHAVQFSVRMLQESAAKKSACLGQSRKVRADCYSKFRVAVPKKRKAVMGPRDFEAEFPPFRNSTLRKPPLWRRRLHGGVLQRTPPHSRDKRCAGWDGRRLQEESRKRM